MSSSGPAVPGLGGDGIDLAGGGDLAGREEPEVGDLLVPVATRFVVRIDTPLLAVGALNPELGTFLFLLTAVETTGLGLDGLVEPFVGVLVPTG